MPRVDVVVESKVPESFRVKQVAGMFDVELSGRMGESFSVEVPDLEEDWQIGAIVGPSGSGKTTIAREAYGRAIWSPPRWQRDHAIVDCFGNAEMKTITHALTSVGFSSPPAWVRPYRVLSNGQQFRCDLARALLSGKKLIVFDEFTSVVDRMVAKIGSAAVSKAVRRSDKRFVAVTCHYDVLKWLEPDWVLDMASGTLARRRLRRPKIHLRLFKCSRNAWGLFKKHHYLAASLPAAGNCYVAMWEGVPTCFVAVLRHFGKHGGNREIRRISRIVVLPDFQGVGIGGRVLDAVASLVVASGSRVRITTSHPGMVARLGNVVDWRITEIKKSGHAARRVDLARAKRRGYSAGVFRGSVGRAVISAEYVGPAIAADAE